MSASFYDLLKYAATGQASPSMTFYDRVRASTLMGGAVQTLSGIPPLSFKADGTPLISWSMKGNGGQVGTPTPDNPVMPTFCGKLVGTDWTIPITCAGQTVPVYLGQTQTVRKIRKLVLTGEENIETRTSAQTGNVVMRLGVSGYMRSTDYTPLSSHYIGLSAISGIEAFVTSGTFAFLVSGSGSNFVYIFDNRYTTAADFKAWLASEYAAGHPVTVWYVLANEQTTISNEPLAQIGTYADELHSEDAGVAIPTANGANVLTVDTPIQPSEMTITFKG